MATALVTSLANAIARQENANPLNNNPGNLKPIPGGWTGQTGVDSMGLAQFATPQDGWNALYNQIQTNIDRGLTLNEFFAGVPGGYPGYASAKAGNQPYIYAANVASWTNLDPNVPLNQIQFGGTAIPGSGTQPILDVGGSAATTSTSDILSSFESSVGSIDVTNPVTDVLLIAGMAGAAWVLMRGF